MNDGNELLHLPAHLSTDETQNQDSGLSPTVPRDVIILLACGGVGYSPVSILDKYALWHAFPAWLDVVLFGFHCSMLTLGFVIIACMAHGNRWRQLAHVAIAGCLIAILANLCLESPHNGWSVLRGIITWAATMSLGGTLSYLFKPRQVPPPT